MGIAGALKNLWKSVGRYGKDISKAAKVEKEGKAVGWLAGIKSSSKAHAASMEALGKDGLKSIGGVAGGNVKKVASNFRKLAGHEYGKRIGNAALIGGGINAATGMVGGDEAGLLERFAYGAAIGGIGRAIAPGSIKVGNKQMGLRNVLMKSNKKLNTKINKMMNGKGAKMPKTNAPAAASTMGPSPLEGVDVS